PADDRPDDHVAGRLVPVRGDPADDRAVIRVAAGVDVAVEERADEGVEGQVDRVDRFEDHQGVPGNRGVDVVGVEPLYRLGWPGHHRRGLAELDRQRIDHLDLALRQAVEHARQLRHRTWAGRHPDALARLAGVVQLQLVFLGDDFLGQRDLTAAASRGCGGLAVGWW